MNVYTYSEARQKLASVLEQAACEGEMRIQRKDGQAFVIRPEQRAAFPLDVQGLDLGLSADEIVRNRPPLARQAVEAAILYGAWGDAGKKVWYNLLM